MQFSMALACIFHSSKLVFYPMLFILLFPMLLSAQTQSRDSIMTLRRYYEELISTHSRNKTTCSLSDYMTSFKEPTLMKQIRHKLLDTPKGIESVEAIWSPSLQTPINSNTSTPSKIMSDLRKKGSGSFNSPIEIASQQSAIFGSSPQKRCHTVREGQDELIEFIDNDIENLENLILQVC
jgi:hypothetical protein